MADVLIVDDEPSILHVLRRMLELWGHSVVEATDGKVAMRILASSPPDLVITDIFMPEMDGFELIEKVKKSFPGLPILAMCGGGVMPKTSMLVTASVLGVDAVLEKPFEVEEVERLVQRLLRAD